MKSIALIAGGVVSNVSLWDGLAVWQPLNLRLCDTTADVTGTPVAPGWAWDAGTLTFTSSDGIAIAISPASVNATQ